MTSRLYLLRHGIAVAHGTPGIDEEARPLTPKGKDRVAEIARGLKRLAIAPERIIASPLPRARQTAEIVADVLGLEREGTREDSEALLPQASAGSIRDWLVRREEDRIMLVGHNPNLSRLLGLLIGLSLDTLPFDLKKGGLAELRRDERSDAYRLHWLTTPRLMRRLADEGRHSRD